MIRLLGTLSVLAVTCLATAPSAAGQTVPSPALEVGLAEGGLTTGQPFLHHADVIAFGERQRAVLSRLSAILGRPDPVRPYRNIDCPSRTVRSARFGYLLVNFQNGRFVGWTVEGHGGTSHLQTYQGLSVGDRRDEIGLDSEVRAVARSRLGHEINVDGIGVGLTGPGPDARVSILYAGKACFGR